MNYIPESWSEKQKVFNKEIRSTKGYDEAIELFFELHSQMHRKNVYGGSIDTICDTILKPVSYDDFKVRPTKNSDTIAWHIWHIARIEDLTMNILVNKGQQIYNTDIKSKINSSVDDTGNAMEYDEISKFSEEINPEELLKYRDEVGKQTRKIVASLSQESLKRKVDKTDIERVLNEGGVLDDPNSVWLLDYWGGKTVAGLLLMPPTRHLANHLNSCGVIKSKIKSK